MGEYYAKKLLIKHLSL